MNIEKFEESLGKLDDESLAIIVAVVVSEIVMRGQGALNTTWDCLEKDDKRELSSFVSKQVVLFS